MEKVTTKKFTAKDLFNSSSATPIKDVAGQTLDIEAVAIRDKVDGQTCGYLKASDGKIYATISQTVIEQLVALAEMVDEGGALKVTVVPKQSNGGRTYYMLELV